MTWPAILHHWKLIVADFHSEYGCELTRDLLRVRDWGWFRTRVLGLLHADTRLFRVLAPRPNGQ